MLRPSKSANYFPTLWDEKKKGIGQKLKLFFSKELISFFKNRKTLFFILQQLFYR